MLRYPARSPIRDLDTPPRWQTSVEHPTQHGGIKLRYHLASCQSGLNQVKPPTGGIDSAIVRATTENHRWVLWP